MEVAAVCDIFRGVVREDGISETIAIVIDSRVVAPVVSAEERSADDVRPARICGVPLIVAVVVGVVRVVEVVVVDEVTA